MTPEGFSDGLRRLLLTLELHPLAPWNSLKGSTFKEMRVEYISGPLWGYKGTIEVESWP